MSPRKIAGPRAALTVFLYKLMNEHLPVSKVEELIEYGISNPHSEQENEHLLDYAEELAERLMY